MSYSLLLSRETPHSEARVYGSKQRMLQKASWHPPTSLELAPYTAYYRIQPGILEQQVKDLIGLAYIWHLTIAIKLYSNHEVLDCYLEICVEKFMELDLSAESITNTGSVSVRGI